MATHWNQQNIKKIVREIVATLGDDLERALRPFRLLPLIPSAHTKPHMQGTHILITGGYGYGNVGDEAQLNANLNRWKQKHPHAHISVLSPHPEYTSEHHMIPAELAPRVIWFHANKRAYYWVDNPYFYIRFFLIFIRNCIAAHLMKAGLPPLVTSAQETHLLYHLQRASLLHISGGGFLTGMTRSRLWENMLLLRLAHILQTPSILTGQTIGVFKSFADRSLAKWGLSHAQSIQLRDKEASENELHSIGLTGEHIHSYYDDALFCKKADDDVIDTTLINSQIDPSKPYVAINYHYWGMTSEMQKKATQQISQMCRNIAQQCSTQLLLLPMTPSDAEPLNALKKNIGNHAQILTYDFDFTVARGVISKSQFVFTMKHHPIIFAYGESVPVISICLDDYYYRKNKGAMALVGHQEYCIDRAVLFSDQSDVILKRFIYQQPKLKKQIQQAIQTYREKEQQILPNHLVS